MLGGRTNHWGRISLRFGPDDFRRKSIDGLGDDWPITYDDIKPYYDKIDQFIGIFGANLPKFPNEPDGIFLPPPTPRCYELLIKRAQKKLNIPSVPSRLSILTRPHNGRAACHYCSQCGRGCSTHSNFSSPSVLIPPALKTGRLKIITNAMAREVTVDDAGLASGVTYVDKTTARDNHVRARIVVLAASACESARILLNSKSSRFPQGLGNSSGNVGKYLTDSTGASVRGFIPALMEGMPHNEDGTGGMHLYTPWWLDNKKLDFPRGYHIEPSGGRRMPSAGFGGGTAMRPTIRPAAAGVRRLRQAAEERLPPPLRRDGELRRPRRDDPEQGHLLRDRSDGRRQVGHPGAALPLQVERLRVQAGEAHAGDLPRDHHRDGRHADDADADRGAGLRHRGGRPHHPRGRRDADGQRSVDVGAEQVLPGARLPERVRRRRRAVRVAGGQEPDVDDPGAGDADVGVHRRAAERAGSSERRSTRGRDPGNAVGRDMPRRTRKMATKIDHETKQTQSFARHSAAAPMAAGLVWTEAEAQQAHHQAQAPRPPKKTATPFSRSSSRATSMRP